MGTAFAKRDPGGARKVGKKKKVATGRKTVKRVSPWGPGGDAEKKGTTGGLNFGAVLATGRQKNYVTVGKRLQKVRTKPNGGLRAQG